MTAAVLGKTLSVVVDIYEISRKPELKNRVGRGGGECGNRLVFVYLGYTFLCTLYNNSSETLLCDPCGSFTMYIWLYLAGGGGVVSLKMLLKISKRKIMML